MDSPYVELLVKLKLSKQFTWNTRTKAFIAREWLRGVVYSFILKGDAVIDKYRMEDIQAGSYVKMQGDVVNADILNIEDVTLTVSVLVKEIDKLDFDSALDVEEENDMFV
ncbi:hypothetical protein NQZ79_g8337 [Umbelopsis isabellina]|nr:hypothetical protein NQZ79_g8337 [Umbelopsis isabellina]